MAELRLGDFEVEWGKKYPAIGPAWRRAWNEVVPFFAYPPQIRKMIYTTNAIESLHRGLRKIIKTRGAFPSDEAAMKLLYLALRNLGVHWKPPSSGEPHMRSSLSSSRTACRLLFNDDQPSMERSHTLYRTLSPSGLRTLDFLSLDPWPPSRAVEAERLQCRTYRRSSINPLLPNILPEILPYFSSPFVLGDTRGERTA